MPACNDYFKEVNQTGITADPFYTTELGVQSLVNSCYSFMRDYYGKVWEFGELGTDIWLSGGDCKQKEYVEYLPTLFPGYTSISAHWNCFYQALNTCNAAVGYIQDCPEMSDADKLIKEGEVRAIRASFLHLIVESWGNVYLSTTPTEKVAMSVQRSPKEDFYTAIIADLEFAMANCAPGKSKNGTVTQAGAQALLARVLLTRAGADYINNSDRNADYLRAAQFAEDLIGNNAFSLWDNYKDAWSMDNADGSGSSEVIWYVDYVNDEILNRGVWDVENNRGVYNNMASGSTGGHKGHTTFITKYDNQEGMERDILNGRPFQRVQPTVHLLNLYDENIDERYEGTFKTVWYANKDPKSATYPAMKLGDTAIYLYKRQATPAMRAAAAGKYLLKDIDDMHEANGAPKGARNQIPYIQMNKFMDDKKLTMNQEWSSRDAIVLRLAEMYLIAAEARLALGETTLALKHINDLRRQRAINGHEAEMEITAANLNIDFILDERARELVGEQTYWFDLKRTGKLLDRVKAHQPEAAPNIQTKHLWKPIPQTFLDAIENSDEFGQNPGW
jgi:hypothetical protein